MPQMAPLWWFFLFFFFLLFIFCLLCMIYFVNMFYVFSYTSMSVNHFFWLW